MQVEPDNNLQARGDEWSWTWLIPVVGQAEMIYYLLTHKESYTKVTDRMSFKADHLLSDPQPEGVVIEGPSFTVTLTQVSSTTTTMSATSTSSAGALPTSNYMLIPPWTPSIQDKTEDLQTRQTERLGFEARALILKIPLTRLTSDNRINMWTADLNVAQLLVLKTDYLMAQGRIVPNAPTDSTALAATNNKPRITNRANSRLYKRDLNSTQDIATNSTQDMVTNSTHKIGTNSTQKNVDIQSPSIKANVLPGFSTVHNAGFDLHTLSNLDAFPNAAGDFSFPHTAGSGSWIYVIESFYFQLSTTEIDRGQGDHNLDGWTAPDRNPRGQAGSVFTDNIAGSSPQNPDPDHPTMVSLSDPCLPRVSRDCDSAPCLS